LVEDIVIMHAPSNRSEIIGRPVLNKSRTPLPRQYDETVRRTRRDKTL